MTEIRFVNVNRVQIAPPIRTRKKRLDFIVAAHAARYGGGERVLVSVHRPGDILAPTSESIFFPSIPDEVEFHERDAFAARLYSARRVEKGEIVLITVTPAGGGRNGGAKIGLTIATLALAAFAFWAGPALAGALNLAKDGIVAKIITAGIVIGGGAVLSAVMRSGQKDSKIYGVTGGGNVPRPNDRIPFGYGEYWNPADGAQPDYYRYQNETDTILFKRVVLGAGKYKLKGIRVGTTTFWTGDLSPNGGVTTSGITSAFPNCKFELLYGEASTLVPSSVITSANVTGQTIPLSTDVNPMLGPFAVNPVGTTINRIQVDYSTPSGYSRNNHETTQDLHFEYAPIDDAGDPTGAWATLYRTTRPMFTTKPLRWSQFLSVPEGRYAVRARNNRAKIDDGDNCEYAWDALRGYTPDTIVRENITEVAMEIRSSKDLGVTSFSDVQFLQERVGPVWNGTTFAEGPIRKCVDAYADLLRDANFGGGIDDDLIDLAKILSYRSAVTEFDTFDGQIRGPTSLWDAAKTILANFRAEPIQIGAGFSFVRDELQSIRRHTFTRRQIVRGSLSMSFAVEADDGSAHVEVAFNDDADPKQPNGAEAYYGVPSIFGPRRVEWQGVSSYEHAMHLARWMAASGFYRRATITFDTELSGRMVKRGDAIAVDPWFVDSRAVSGVLSASGNTLNLDADVTVVTDDRAMLRDREGKEWGPVRVTQGANARQVVLNSTDVTAEEADTGIDLVDVLADSGAQPTAILIGPLTELGEQWLVQSMQPAEKGRTRITAKLDSAAVYTAIDEEITAQDPISWTLTPAEAPTVTTLRANVVQHTSSLAAQWSIEAQVGAVRYEVQVAYGDNEGAWETVYAGPAPVGDAPIRYLDTEEPVYVRARAFGATGLTGGWETSDPIVAPKPTVTADVPRNTLDPAFSDLWRRLLDRVSALEIARDEDGARYQVLDAVTLEETRAIVSRLERVFSRMGNTRASVSTLQTAVTDLNGAFAGYQVATDAAIDAISAEGVLEFAQAVSLPTGAASGARMLVKATDTGNFAEAGIEAYAEAGGGGSPDGFTVLVGNRIYRRKSSESTIHLMVDDNGRFIGDALGSGVASLYKEFTRAEPGSDGAVGSGTTASNAGNSYIDSSSLGTITIPENPDSIGDGATASDYCPVLVAVNATARNGSTGWGFGSANPMVVAFRVKFSDGTNTFYSKEGLIACASSWNGAPVYGFGGNPGSMTGITQIKAGTYSVYLQYRWGPRTANGMTATATEPAGLQLRIAAEIATLILKK